MAKGHDGYTSKPKGCADCGAPLPIPRGLRLVRCRSCQRLRRNTLKVLWEHRAEEKAEAQGKWAVCSAEGCKRAARHPGGIYCSTHQWRHNSGKDMNLPIRLKTVRGTRWCEVEGCEYKHLARGYCSAHYGRWRRGLRGPDLTCSKRRSISPERQVRLDLEAQVKELTRELIEIRKLVEWLKSRIQERELKGLRQEPSPKTQPLAPPTLKKCAKCRESFIPNATRRMLCGTCFSLANDNPTAEGVW